MPAPKVHYLWVGPHPLAINAGQDTLGPDLMRQKYPSPKQPIYFWCLDSEVEYYKDYFAKAHPDSAPIEVKGIESFTDTLPPLPYKEIDLKKAFITLMTKLKDRAECFQDRKDKIREWITLKEAFGYFLQLAEDGFVTDTNCRPAPYDETDKKSIPETLSSPESTGFQCTFFPANTDKSMRPDPWLMYSGNPTDKIKEEAKARFKAYIDKVTGYLSECEVDGQFIPMNDVKGEGDLPIRGWIATQWCHVALDNRVSPIPTREPLSASKLRDSLETPLGFVKRLHGSHYNDHHLEKVSMLERVLVGTWSPQEFYHYAKRHPMNPFEAFHCESVKTRLFRDTTNLQRIEEEIEELKQTLYELKMNLTEEPLSEKAKKSRVQSLEDILQLKFNAQDAEEVRIREELQRRFPNQITFVQLALGLSKYHELGAMLVFSHDPRVSKVLRECPIDSGCMETYFLKLADSNELSAEALFEQVKALLALTNQIYPLPTETPPPESLSAFIELIHDEKAISAHRCLDLLATLGPITDETHIEPYIAELQTWSQAEKPAHSPTHFKEARPTTFSETAARETLSKLLTSPATLKL